MRKGLTWGVLEALCFLCKFIIESGASHPSWNASESVGSQQTFFSERNHSRRAGNNVRSFLGSSCCEACTKCALFKFSSTSWSWALVSFSFSCHSTSSCSFFTTSLFQIWPWNLNPNNSKSKKQYILLSGQWIRQWVPSKIISWSNLALCA